MDELKNRIIFIQTKSKLSQTQFAEKLGFSRNFINDVKNSKTSITDRTVKLICSVYNVNENWLKRGEEPIYVEEPIDEFAEFDENDPIYPILRVCKNLTQENRAIVMNQIDLIIAKQKYEDLLKSQSAR